MTLRAPALDSRVRHRWGDGSRSGTVDSLAIRTGDDGTAMAVDATIAYEVAWGIAGTGTVDAAILEPLDAEPRWIEITTTTARTP